jgi:hypothetical protein
MRNLVWGWFILAVGKAGAYYKNLDVTLELRRWANGGMLKLKLGQEICTICEM